MSVSVAVLGLLPVCRRGTESSTLAGDWAMPACKCTVCVSVCSLLLVELCPGVCLAQPSHRPAQRKPEAGRGWLRCPGTAGAGARTPGSRAPGPRLGRSQLVLGPPVVSGFGPTQVLGPLNSGTFFVEVN